MRLYKVSGENLVRYDGSFKMYADWEPVETGQKLEMWRLSEENGLETAF